MLVWTAVGAVAAGLTLVLVAWDLARRALERKHAKEPPLCVYCGISAHAPKEQTRLACPRNPNGIGHQYAWGPPEALPPPTTEVLERAILNDAWGESRYRPESQWNDDEHRGYVRLHRRDDAGQGFRVTVFDPSNEQSDASFAAGDRSVLARYPDDFDDAPPLMPGRYAVRWYAVVDRGGEPQLEEVAQDSFDVP